MKNTCIIIDDEPVAIEVIQNHLRQLEDFEVKATFTNPIKAAGYLSENRINLIFLDIEMPVLSGFELLSSLPDPPKIIITTAHRDYAPEAFNMEVVDYLLKPISLDRLLKAVNKYHREVAPERQHPDRNPDGDEGHIIIKADKKFHKVLFHDICYIESMDDFIRIHISGNKFDCYERLVGMEKKLPPGKFLRIHRSYIINIDKTDSFTNTSVQIGDKVLVIGKKYRETVLSKLQDDQ